MNISKGRYWQEGITLVDGCTPCSPGCEHCWSAGIAHRFSRTGKSYKSDGNTRCWPFLTDEKTGKFNGRIEVYPERLKRFNTRKPKVFAIWNDLGHPDIPPFFLTQVYHAMAEFKQNIYLCLTKRPETFLREFPNPLENVYWGLTVCNQAEADEKIPIFLQVPGKKFLSIEPMLGAIDIVSFLPATLPALDRAVSGPRGDCLDAVILGGETGPGARPLHPDWVRSVRNQCAAAGVPFFFKQWGEWLPANQGKFWELATFKNAHAFIKNVNGTNKHTLDAIKVGRNKAGRELDGRTHDDLPWMKRSERNVKL